MLPYAYCAFMPLFVNLDDGYGARDVLDELFVRCVEGTQKIDAQLLSQSRERKLMRRNDSSGVTSRCTMILGHFIKLVWSAWACMPSKLSMHRKHALYPADNSDHIVSSGHNVHPRSCIPKEQVDEKYPMLHAPIRFESKWAMCKKNKTKCIYPHQQ